MDGLRCGDVSPFRLEEEFGIPFHTPTFRLLLAQLCSAIWRDRLDGHDPAVSPKPANRPVDQSRICDTTPPRGARLLFRLPARPNFPCGLFSAPLLNMPHSAVALLPHSCAR